MKFLHLLFPDNVGIKFSLSSQIVLFIIIANWCSYPRRSPYASGSFFRFNPDSELPVISCHFTYGSWVSLRDWNISLAGASPRVAFWDLKNRPSMSDLRSSLLGFVSHSTQSSVSPSSVVNETDKIMSLRVQAVFHKTVRVCHIYYNFKLGFTCWITIIFGTLKDGSLLINTWASNICFSYRKHVPKWLRRFVKNSWRPFVKNSKFYPVQIIWKCSHFASLSHKHVLRNYKWHFRLSMSAFATAISNTLSKHQLFTLNFAFQLFHVSIAIDNCRSQKYHL